jgi:hypothetical protein
MNLRTHSQTGFLFAFREILNSGYTSDISGELDEGVALGHFSRV